jgi:S1-C subfamily serine protease
MKKLLAIIVLGLMWSEPSFSLSQQQAINQYLSGKKLDSTEGIWITHRGNILAIYKSGSSYSGVVVGSHEFLNSGATAVILNKNSNSIYTGTQTWPMVNNDNQVIRTQQARVVYNISGNRALITVESSYRREFSRLWPENIRSHNAKFEKKKEPKKKKDEFKSSSGTAFFVTQKGHVITNFHVVESCKDKSKIVYQNKEIKVKLLAKDKYLDLALLKADIESKHFIKISNKPPKKLQRIIAAGYPFGKYLSDDMKFTSGIVSSLKGLGDDSTRLQIDAALNPGNSGGPIVDEKTGNLVAVAVSGLNKDLIDNQAVNFGIKAGSVKNFLESNQIDTLTQSKYSFGSVDLSNILEKATVYTFCN